jgi:hypothetical protein
MLGSDHRQVVRGTHNLLDEIPDRGPEFESIIRDLKKHIEVTGDVRGRRILRTLVGHTSSTDMIYRFDSLAFPALIQFKIIDAEIVDEQPFRIHPDLNRDVDGNLLEGILGRKQPSEGQDTHTGEE